MEAAQEIIGVFIVLGIGVVIGWWLKAWQVTRKEQSKWSS